MVSQIRKWQLETFFWNTFQTQTSLFSSHLPSLDYTVSTTHVASGGSNCSVGASGDFRATNLVYNLGQFTRMQFSAGFNCLWFTVNKNIGCTLSHNSPKVPVNEYRKDLLMLGNIILMLQRSLLNAKLVHLTTLHILQIHCKRDINIFLKHLLNMCANKTLTPDCTFAQF